MAYKLSPELAQACLDGGGLGPALEDSSGFYLHIFGGPVPEQPQDALDMVNDHTFLVRISVSGGATGATFDAAVGALIQKAVAETWEGTAAFDGADDASPALAATFFRVAPIADNCRGAGSGPRLQGTITATGGGGDMERADPSIADAGSVSVTTFDVRVTSVA